MATLTPILPSRHNIVRGIVLRCASVLCYAAMSACMKAASADGVGAIEMLFYRSTIGLPVVILWLAAGPGIAAIRTRRPRAHLGRAAIGISAILMNFKALILLPLATATTIGFSAPIFATLLSALFLSEKVGPHRWGAVLLGFAGIALVVHPGSGTLPQAGIAFALLGALGTASVYVTIRQLGSTENPGTIVFWFFTCSAIVSGIAMLWLGHWHAWPTMLFLFAGAIAGAMMQLLMTMSLQAAPVSAIAPFDYTQMLWATLLGWLFWNDMPTTYTVAGAVLIIVSGLYTALRENRLRKLTVATTPPLE